MPLSRDIMERVEVRVREYHLSSKLKPEGDGSPPRPLDPRTKPDVFRLFDGYPKAPLPTNLLAAAVPTISVLQTGLDAIPESQRQPAQDMRTLATWLYLGAGLRSGSDRFRSCPSEGFLFPCEIYVAALAVEGLQPGLYHFSVREFALRKLRDGWETLAQLKRGRPDLEFLKTVPAVLLVSTIFSRSTWRYKKRGYRHCLTEAGQLIQNLGTAATGAGIQALTRLRVNNQTTRELIGIAPDAGFAEAEVVQGVVIWADKASKPFAPPAGVPSPGPTTEMLPRPALANDVVGYGSIMAAHEDCVAPGMAVREIRPPVSELSPLSKEFPWQDLPVPSTADGGESLGRVLLTKTAATDFPRATIPRDLMWNLDRLAFRGGAPFPLFPDGPHVALVRPFWVINDVTGMDAGIWYYNPQQDRWSLMSRGRHRMEAKYLMLDDEAFANASAVCFLFANLNRLLNDGGPDLYRLSHLEAGMAAHRLYLSALGSGLATKFSSQFYDDAVKQFLGLDKTGWDPIYIAAIGAGGNAALASDTSSDEAQSWRG